MAEKHEESEIVAWAKANDWIVRKLKWIGRRGAADRFFLKAGRPVLMEVKDIGETLEPGSLQEREFDRFVAEGAEIYVVNHRSQGIKALRDGPLKCHDLTKRSR